MIEYDYDIEDIIKENKKCIVCDIKFKSIYKIGVCFTCFKNLMITRSNAKKIYKLKDNELENLISHKRKSQYHDCITFYSLKDVRIMAIDKKYNILGITKKLYKQYVNEILKETASINANKISQYDFKYIKLFNELKKYNLKIRKDSYYCNSYLSGKFKLKETVDMMISMNFFVTKTKYMKILKKYIDKDYYITEEMKNNAKKLALKPYLKNNDSKNVPNIIKKLI